MSTAAFEALSADLEQIPLEIRELPRWVVWRLEEREQRGETKWTKVPYRVADVSRRASSTKPRSWGAFGDAVAVLNNGCVNGVGFVLNGDGLCALDLDHCVAAGVIEPWAREMIAAICSYTELSPSGSGIRILARGVIPAQGKKKGNVEMYSTKRFVTITGNHLDGTPRAIEERTAELVALRARVFKFDNVKVDRRPRAHPEIAGTAALDDGEIIRRATNAKNGGKFSALWSGSTVGYPSASEADLALCSALAFWTDRDAARMDRMFRASGLFREKWDERHGDQTYGEKTVDLAVAGCRETYRPDSSRRRTEAKPAHKTTVDNTHDSPRPTFVLTDLGNAGRLVLGHGADFRFCSEAAHGGWLHWDGRRWAPDTSGAIMRAAKATTRAMLLEAAALEDMAAQRELASHALRSQKAERLTAIVRLAASEPGIPVRQAELDTDPWLLNVENGTVDLRNGRLRSHRRDDLLTRLAPVAYEPAAACPKFEAFLTRIFDGNDSMIAFVQRAIGYTLTGDVRERVLFILWGGGRNGKTTLLDVIRTMLGDYGLRTPTETLMAKRDGAIPNDVARLKGARFVSASESQEGKRLDEARVKDLTGGDPMPARFMRAEWFDFKPECKLWLGTNHKPVINGTDEAIWDRVRLVPFTVRIPDDEQDKELVAKLQAEAPGILRWAVEGCLAWQRDGLGAPDEVVCATGTYRGEMDALAQFLEEHCIVEPGATAKAGELFAAYARWAEASREHPLPQRSFGLALTERGFKRGRSNGAHRWHGIRLGSAVPQVPHSAPDSRMSGLREPRIGETGNQGSDGALGALPGEFEEGPL